MPKLRGKLKNHLRSWKTDIGRGWVEWVDGDGPAYEDVCKRLTIRPDEPIFPGRKGESISGAPQCAHVFRAFDDLQPSEVKVVIVGQDPYDNVAQATGRAFEQGGLCTWKPSQGRVAPSLQNIVKQLVEYREPRSDESALHITWKCIKNRLKDNPSWLPSPTELFDHWHSEKILLLNMALTFTKSNSGGELHEHQLCGHFPLWKRFVTKVLRKLRENDSVLFMFWGKRSFGLLRSDVGLCDGDPHVIIRAHPSRSKFMRGENVFCAADRFLCDKSRQIAWLPPSS